MTATSESGRRKSARCARIVVSTPTHCATWLLPCATVLSDAYGSGWTRKRYQLSSCDSMPHPNWCTPTTSCWKSVIELSPGRRSRALGPVDVHAGVRRVDARRREPVEEVRRARRVGQRRSRCSSSRFVGIGAAVEEVGLVVVVAWHDRPLRRRLRARPGWHALPRRGPSDELTMPMCMSCTGGNSAVEPACGARAVERSPPRDLARRVDAVGRHEARDQIGDGLGEVGLLVAHRRRVVDVEEEVDLVDGRRARST